MKKYLIFITIITVGVILRLFVSRLGHNFDLESYWIVGDIVTRGGNVYSETTRYNYGPIWFYIVGLFYLCTEYFGRGFNFFGFLISLFLTCVDLGIFYILYKKYNLFTASLFFLNPISIIITGYHRQFDNLAILVALIGLYFIPNNITVKKAFLISLVLGISIMIKHVFFVLPLWLFFSKDIKGWNNKFIILILPILIFIFSFVPFWSIGSEGIINNVFLYKSFANSPFWFIFSPLQLRDFLSSTFIFILVLSIFGFILKNLKVFDLGLFYTLILVVFAPAIANQYLAICIAAISAYPNIFFFLYTYTSSLLLFKDGAGLSRPLYTSNLPFDSLILHTNIRAYDLIILFLLFGLIHELFKRYSKVLKKVNSFIYKKLNI